MEWISVKDRLPEDDNQKVLWLWDGGQCVTIEPTWNVKGWLGNKITHWMPIPEPPKGE